MQQLQYLPGSVGRMPASSHTAAMNWESAATAYTVIGAFSATADNNGPKHLMHTLLCSRAHDSGN